MTELTRQEMLAKADEYAAQGAVILGYGHPSERECAYASACFHAANYWALRVDTPMWPMVITDEFPNGVDMSPDNQER